MLKIGIKDNLSRDAHGVYFLLLESWLSIECKDNYYLNRLSMDKDPYCELYFASPKDEILVKLKDFPPYLKNYTEFCTKK